MMLPLPFVICKGGDSYLFCEQVKLFPLGYLCHSADFIIADILLMIKYYVLYHFLLENISPL